MNIKITETKETEVDLSEKTPKEVFHLLESFFDEVCNSLETDDYCKFLKLSRKLIEECCKGYEV